MTIERKIIVGIEDIKAISIECLSCNAILTVPAHKLGDFPKSCQQPNCESKWGVPPSSLKEMESPFVNFISSIKSIRGLTPEGIRKSGFRILLEFDEPQAR